MKSICKLTRIHDNNRCSTPTKLTPLTLSPRWRHNLNWADLAARPRLWRHTPYQLLDNLTESSPRRGADDIRQNTEHISASHRSQHGSATRARKATGRLFLCRLRQQREKVNWSTSVTLTCSELYRIRDNLEPISSLSRLGMWNGGGSVTKQIHGEVEVSPRSA